MSRRVYVWDEAEQCLVEVGGDRLASGRVPLVGDAAFEGARSPDGEDLGTRRKHREYLKRTGLATADDFKETWAKAGSPRDEPGRRDAVAREFTRVVEMPQARYDLELRARRGSRNAQ